MELKQQIFKSSNGNVSKFVFTGSDISVEAVLYKYNSAKDRTVICCSTQCGCPVGCSFCGTGKFFQRNLSTQEIVRQVDAIVETLDCMPSEIEKFQIMFMSMGEPFLNYDNLESAIRVLNDKYPNAKLLVSTSAPLHQTFSNFDKFVKLSKEIENVGIQFSVHESNDDARRKLIPTSTSSLQGIGTLGERWAVGVGRKPFFNYCVHDGNDKDENVTELLENFEPNVWECTLSVICEADSTMQNAINSKLDLIKSFSDKMLDKGYSLRIFNPAGQDDIGGGCGQLWYFQEWAKKQRKH